MPVPGGGWKSPLPYGGGGLGTNVYASYKLQIAKRKYMVSQRTAALVSLGKERCLRGLFMSINLTCIFAVLHLSFGFQPNLQRYKEQYRGALKVRPGQI